MTDPSCLFCRIGKGELEVATVAASGAAVAFLDLHPHAPGHTLVVPRSHATSLAELPEDQVGPLFELAQAAARKLEDVLRPDGMTIGINQGAGQQDVAHLHVHLMPRFRGDGGGSIHSVVKNPPSSEQQELIDTLTS